LRYGAEFFAHDGNDHAKALLPLLLALRQVAVFLCGNTGAKKITGLASPTR
jgi:hypothetical protein